MTARMYYDNDADPKALAGQTVAIIGYGSQGHAHALNLHESGVKVIVGLAAGSKSRAHAQEAGLEVAEARAAGHDERVDRGEPSAQVIGDRELQDGPAEHRGDDVGRIVALLERARLPVTIPDLGLEKYLHLMGHDKKVEGGKLRFILMREMGRAFLTDAVQSNLLAEALNMSIARD